MFLVRLHQIGSIWVANILHLSPTRPVLAWRKRQKQINENKDVVLIFEDRERAAEGGSSVQ